MERKRGRLLAVATVGARADTEDMSAWWDEQLAAYSPAAPLPAAQAPHAPVSAAGVPQDHHQHRNHAAVAHNEWHWWWNHARITARLLARGVDPPAIDVFGPVLDQDEEAVLSTGMHYSRQYGGDGCYQKADLLIVGRPAVMAAGFAISAAVNHRRKVAARREAQVRWRDHQHVQVIATSDRLLCSTDKGWFSAWYENVTEFYPDLQSWSVTLGFEPGVAPLRLSGPPAPMICLWAATCLLGERWANDPRLNALVHCALPT